MTRNILYVSLFGGLGGGETSLLAYLRALDRTHYAPRVICGAHGAFVDALCENNIPVQVIPFAPISKRNISRDFFYALYQDLRAQPTALIHCNNSEGAHYAAPFAKFLGMPLVLTMHGAWQLERQWKRTFIEWSTTCVLTPTQLLAQTFLQKNPRMRERITVLPFGVDTREFSPGARDETLADEFGIARDASIVTLLARFQSVKGHANLLDAIPRILDAFPGTRFLFVGDAAFDTRDANETRRAVLERVNADARLRAAIVFAGFRRDIPRVLRATDVLVSPSDFESYGMAILEAMACGVPVVSTNVGGPSETLLEGETGFLIPPRDPNALAARVIQLLANRDLRYAMGANGRRRVETHYALADSVARLQDIYSGLCR